MKPAASSWTAGLLAGGLFVVAGLILFVIAPVVRTSLSRQLGFVALTVSGLAAGGFAVRFSRGRAPSATGVLLSVIPGILCGVLALVVIGAIYWVVAVIWFVHFSHFTW
jgi:hypothetical protein